MLDRCGAVAFPQGVAAETLCVMSDHNSLRPGEKLNTRGSVGDSADDWRQLKGGLPRPVDDADERDLLWQELAAQFKWYDRAATRSRYGYQSLRLLSLIVSAAVTVLAAIGAPPGLTASFAAAVVVAEGAQQLFQLHVNWISYRSTAETLRQHAFLYAAVASPYTGAGRRDALAKLMRDLTAGENTTWAATMHKAAEPQTPST